MNVRVPRRLARAGAAFPTPFIVAAALLLNAYSESAAHWTHLARPVAVLMAAVLAVCVAVAVAGARQTMTTVIAVLTVFTLFGNFDLAIAGGVAATTGALVTRRRRATIPRGGLLVPAAILFALMALRLHEWQTVSTSDLTLDLPATQPEGSTRGQANVYLLLLDGYPRHDTLWDLGIDNGPFLSSLADLEFEVNARSTSDFQRTELTLASMTLDDTAELHGQAAATGFDDLVNAQREVRRRYLVNGPTLNRFRDLGYTLTYIPSPVTHTDWSGWDERRDMGTVTDLEILLIQRSPLKWALGGWLLDDLRGRVVRSLEAWAEPGSAPRLTFAHLMAPHPPFVLVNDVRAPPACWYAQLCNLFDSTASSLELSDRQYAELLAAQVSELNSVVLEAVARVVREDPGATIVLFSDHGARWSEPPNDEWNRTLFAARSPRRDAPDKATGLLLYLVDAAKGPRRD